MSLKKRIIIGISFLLLLSIFCINKRGGTMSNINNATIQTTIQHLLSLHGDKHRTRIEQGIKQTANLWQKKDGDSEAFTQFCVEAFIVDENDMDITLVRFERNMESLEGHFVEIYRNLSEPMHLDMGTMLPVDYLFAEYSPFSHLNEDLFKTKIAFTALLNFPYYTLKERLKLGRHWNRNEWAQARLTERFIARVPAEINQQINQVYVKAEDYIANYNIYMHHVLTGDGERLFPEKLKLISHWGLRDELKARYTDPEGLKKQETIQTIMEKIILQQIPKSVINNPGIDWSLIDNRLQITEAKDISEQQKPDKITSGMEPDTRYKQLLNIFHAEKMADSYYSMAPDKMARRFQLDREIPETTVEELFISILSSDEIKQTAKLIEKRLERRLKPFDIWYNGFKAGGQYSESELDKIVAKKYTDIDAFEKGIPKLLMKLDFDKETASFLGSKIKVDPARGAGHALGAERREDNAHLRTRVPVEGMNYKGYNIACHELGHNCEQVLSLNGMDNTLLSGVPNTAFTEAFAFVFQDRDLELLNLKTEDLNAESTKVLDLLWSTYEIAGVSLVDMRVWHWMYNHPKASAAELKEAVIQIAKDVWNAYFAPVFGIRDVILLAVYSHMIDAGLYLPDYPLGHIISFQIEEYLKGKKLGEEMVRMCRLGSITPDAWMQQAVGQSISTEPLLKAAGTALEGLYK